MLVPLSDGPLALLGLAPAALLAALAQDVALTQSLPRRRRWRRLQLLLRFAAHREQRSRWRLTAVLASVKKVLCPLGPVVVQAQQQPHPRRLLPRPLLHRQA